MILLFINFDLHNDETKDSSGLKSKHVSSVAVDILKSYFKNDHLNSVSVELK